MSEAVVLPPAADPDYVVWRGESLAKLAIVRLPDLTPYPPPPGRKEVYDFTVMNGTGPLFDLVVKAFSSFRLPAPDFESRPWQWGLPADLVRRARGGANPVVLFVFDADKEHGRYARLDTLPEPPADAEVVQVELPVERAITRASVERLVREFAPQA